MARLPASESDATLPTIARRSFVDRSVVVVLIAIWIASVVRIALEAVQHRPFGVEATVAVAMALVVPFVLRSAVHSHRPVARPRKRGSDVPLR